MMAPQIVLSRTRFGAYCYTIGNNEGAAEKIGIPVRPIKVATFCISGASAAVSGILLSMYLGEVTTFTGRGHVLPGTLIFIAIYLVSL